MPKFRNDSNGRLVVSRKDMVKALTSLGYYPVRMSGDHLIMKEHGGQHMTGVAVSGIKELGQGEMSRILNDTGQTKEDIIWALKRR